MGEGELSQAVPENQAFSLPRLILLLPVWFSLGYSQVPCLLLSASLFWPLWSGSAFLDPTPSVQLPVLWKMQMAELYLLNQLVVPSDFPE